MTEGILSKVPNKIDDTVYSIYTDYEGDFTKPYTTILGCKVGAFDSVPEGMVSVNVEGGVYQTFTAKGDLMKGVVYEKWLEIWNDKMDRAYTTDFEIYNEKPQNINDAEVEIFISLNK